MFKSSLIYSSKWQFSDPVPPKFWVFFVLYGRLARVEQSNWAATSSRPHLKHGSGCTSLIVSWGGYWWALTHSKFPRKILFKFFFLYHWIAFFPPAKFSIAASKILEGMKWINLILITKLGLLLPLNWMFQDCPLSCLATTWGNCLQARLGNSRMCILLVLEKGTFEDLMWFDCVMY